MRRSHAAAVGLAFLLIAGAIAFLPGSKGQALSLPALGADISSTSVSGLSSGGYMAGQFHVAHSSMVIGAGIIAAGPFGCAQSAAGEAIPFFAGAVYYNALQAQNGCMADRLASLDVLNGKRLAGLAARLAAKGEIDPPDELRRAKVLLYSGRDDRTVAPSVVEAARDFYLAAGVAPENLRLVEGQPGGHAFLTAATGNACAASKPPYVNNCGYDQAGAILSFIYGELEPKRAARPENWLTFDQRSFTGSAASMAEEGAVYAPASCRASPGCRVHVVYHGCKQSRAEVGDAFVRGSGFAEWAEANRIVVLFPQAKSSALNPQTCWDWWGYSGLDYLSREAPQIKAVAAMVSRLGAPAEKAAR